MKKLYSAFAPILYTCDKCKEKYTKENDSLNCCKDVVSITTKPIKVKDIETGIVYKSMSDCAAKNGINRKTLYSILKSKNNNTNFILI